MRRRWSVLLGLVACASNATPPAPSAPAPAPCAIAPAPAPCATPLAPPPAPAPPAFDADAWLATRNAKWKNDKPCFDAGMKESTMPCTCDRALALRSPAIELLACVQHRDTRDVYAAAEGHTLLFRVVQGAPRLVFDVPTSIMTDDPQPGGFVNLGVEVAPSGDGVVVRDVPIGSKPNAPPSAIAPAACDASIRAVDDRAKEIPTDAGWRSHRDTVHRMCGSRGRYAWRDGRFVKSP